jgi:hypothetical protein
MLALFLELGRSVKPVRYSMMKSISSNSLIGLEGGMPSLTGAESPLNRSPNSLLEDCCWELRGRWSICDGDDRVGALGLSLGTNAANDFARECRTDLDRDRAEAVGCTFCRDDSRREPIAGRSGVYALPGDAGKLSPV